MTHACFQVQNEANHIQIGFEMAFKANQKAGWKVCHLLDFIEGGITCRIGRLIRNHRKTWVPNG